jgi:hypothetical protein
MPSTTVYYECTVPAERYWPMSRNSESYAQYCATAEDMKYEVISDVKNADGTVTRVSKNIANKSPLPSWVARQLGMKSDEFSFETTETFSNEEYDAKHPLKYTVKPPVMPDKIKVSGSQWVEPLGTGCKLGFRLEVSVNIFGIGGQIASGVLKNTVESFEKMPARVAEYVRLHGAVDEVLRELSIKGRSAEMNSKLAVARWRMAIKAVMRINRWRGLAGGQGLRELMKTVSHAAVAVAEQSATVMQKFARARSSSQHMNVLREATGSTRRQRLAAIRVEALPSLEDSEKSEDAIAVSARVHPKTPAVRPTFALPAATAAPPAAPAADAAELARLKSQLEEMGRRLGALEQRATEPVSVKLVEPVRIGGCCTIT